MVKRAVALRAQHRCSFPGCNQITSGPSAESPTSVAIVGVAAHVSAAAPGGRRYRPELTPQQRKSIHNAIWLCQTHGTLIDRDDVEFTEEAIVGWKAEHEARIASELHLATSRHMLGSNDIVAIGPDIVAVGKIDGGGAAVWQVRLSHFVVGEFSDLVSYIDNFQELNPMDRYVLVSELGDGRVLTGPPEWRREDSSIVLHLDVRRSFPRRRAQDLGSDLKLGADGDLVLNAERNDVEIVSGFEAFPQKLSTSLGMIRGESDLFPNAGSRLSEYFALFDGTPWLSALIKVEVIRLSAVPYQQDIPRDEYLPLMCVNRVYSANISARRPQVGRVSLDLELDVEGVGRWSGTVDVFVGPSSTEGTFVAST